MRARRLFSALAIAVCACASTLAPTVAPSISAEAADLPARDSPSNFPDISGMFEAYPSLSQEVRAENLAYVVRAQARASVERRTQAARDLATLDPSLRPLIRGAGQELAGYIEEAASSGKLPLTSALLPTLIPEIPSVSEVRNEFAISRPVFVEPSSITQIAGVNYEAVGALTFPSDIALREFVTAYTFASFVPEIAAQIAASGAFVAESAIIAGLDSPLDVMAGRALAVRILAFHFNDDDVRAQLRAARKEVRGVLEAICMENLGHSSLSRCLDASVESGLNLEVNQGLVVAQHAMTFDFPSSTTFDSSVANAGAASAILAESFPDLSPPQLRQLLTLTALPAGTPYDLAGAVSTLADKDWGRINLAAALAATPKVSPDGYLTLADKHISVENQADSSRGGAGSSGVFHDISEILTFPVAWLALLVFFIFFVAFVVIVWKLRRKVEDEWREYE